MTLQTEQVRILTNYSDQVHEPLIIQHYGYNDFSFKNTQKIGWYFHDFTNAVLLRDVTFGVNNQGKIYAQGKHLISLKDSIDITQLVIAFNTNCKRNAPINLNKQSNLNLKPEYVLFVFHATFGYNLMSNLHLAK